MSKKNKNDNNLGRAIIKDRFSHQRRRRGKQESMFHTSDLEDGYNWGRLNLQSVTEQSNLDDFLATAELAGTEFTAEKMNVTFVTSKITEGLLTSEEKQKVFDAQESNKQLLCIPRRPKWDSTTTAEELELKEREAFLDWRRHLSQLQDVEGIIMTPFEKNLEFWRQLWRVIERSDVVVQIVDARNPLLFRCEDLEKYVTEVSANKINMILVNKADFLTQSQREAWQNFFDGVGLPVVFFSAIQEYDCAVESEASDIEEAEKETDSDEDVDQLEKHLANSKMSTEPDQAKLENKLVAPSPTSATNETKVVASKEDESIVTENTQRRGYLCTKLELVELFKNVHTGTKVQEGRTTIGLVGYPNVGKSSTINAILSCKKVSVSATPGKTKHFQTLFVDETLCLCDCPGLVMPTFVSTKADMVVNGILPIDQMRDHVGPVNLIASFIPRHILESTYGIRIPKPIEGEDPLRQPSSEEVLNSYGYMRGFMTQRGLPDNPRASRYILKDYVKGKLLYCHAPPNVEQDEFHQFPPPIPRGEVTLTPLQARISKPNKLTSQDLDKAFFREKQVGFHVMTDVNERAKAAVVSLTGSTLSLAELGSKPWRNKKRVKREKLRKTHIDLMN